MFQGTQNFMAMQYLSGNIFCRVSTFNSLLFVWNDFFPVASFLQFCLHSEAYTMIHCIIDVLLYSKEAGGCWEREEGWKQMGNTTHDVTVYPNMLASVI